MTPLEARSNNYFDPSYAQKFPYDEDACEDLLSNEEDNFGACDIYTFSDENEITRRAIEESRQESICPQVTPEIQQLSHSFLRSFDRGRYFSSLREDAMHNKLITTIPEEIVIRIANLLHDSSSSIISLMLVSKNFYFFINKDANKNLIAQIDSKRFTPKLEEALPNTNNNETTFNCTKQKTGSAWIDKNHWHFVDLKKNTWTQWLNSTGRATAVIATLFLTAIFLITAVAIGVFLRVARK